MCPQKPFDLIIVFFISILVKTLKSMFLKSIYLSFLINISHQNLKSVFLKIISYFSIFISACFLSTITHPASCTCMLPFSAQTLNSIKGNPHVKMLKLCSLNLSRFSPEKYHVYIHHMYVVAWSKKKLPWEKPQKNSSRKPKEEKRKKSCKL